MNKYKCDHSNEIADIKDLGRIRPRCLQSFMSRHDKLLEFVKTLICNRSDRHEDDCDIEDICMEALEILEEIGE